MKKYITTDKHPELKKGVIIEFEFGEWGSYKGWIYMKKEDIDLSLKKGFIKELQEPKWTDEDMIAFTRFSGYVMENDSAMVALEKFKQNKNKSKIKD